MTKEPEELPEPDWDELAARAERGELRPIGGRRSGEASRAEGRAMLMAATGTDNIEDALRVALEQARNAAD